MLRSLKKALALSVVIAMMLSSVVAFAAVPADVKGTNTEQAARSLGILKIMVGDEKGNFNPDADVTREEMAKIIVAATGIQNVVPGATKFSDVKADDWSSGYVNFAAGQGIVKGTSATTFDPKGKVTFEQAVTMIMRALGYEPAATAPGSAGYPIAYLTLATNYEVTDGVKGTIGQPAKRSDIAQLVYNALDVPMMIQNSYGSDVKYVESGKDGSDVETLLSKKHKVEAYEEITITEVNELEKTITTECKDEDLLVEYDDRGYNEGEYEVIGDLPLAAFEDTDATIWVNDDDEVINIVSDKNSVVVYDYIDNINGKDSDKLDESDFDDNLDSISFKNNKVQYSVDEDGFKFNDVELTEELFDEDNDKEDEEDILLGEIADGAELPFSNLVKAVVRDNKIVSVEVIWVDDADATFEGIIKKVDADMITYYEDDKDEDVDYEDFAGDDVKKVVVVIDGVTSNFSDLKEGMYFASEALDADEEEFIIVASAKTVKGKFSSLNEEDLEIKVDDKYYALADNYFYSEEGTDFESKNADADTEDLFDDLYDQEIELVLNGCGKVAYVTGKSDLQSFYGFALEDEDDELRVGFVKENKFTEKTYALDSDFEIGFIQSNGDVIYDDDRDFEIFKKGNTGVYKFELNSDGEIEKATKLEFLDTFKVVDFGDDEIKALDSTLLSKKPEVDVADFFDVVNLDVSTDAKVADTSDEIDALDWKIISETDEDRIAKNTINFNAYADEDGDVRVVAFVAGADKLGALPVLGYVTDAPYNTSDDRITSINDGTSVKTYKLDKDEYDNVKKEGLVLLQKTGNDSADLTKLSSEYYLNYKKFMNIVSNHVYGEGYTTNEYNYAIAMLAEMFPEHNATEANGELTAMGYGYVEEIKSSSKLDLYNVGTVVKSGVNATSYMVGDHQDDMDDITENDGDSIDFGDDVMVYKLESKELTKASVSSIGKGDRIYFVVVDDEIVFAIFEKKSDI